MSDAPVTIIDKLRMYSALNNDQGICKAAIKHISTQAARIAELADELETERMRLVACGVVAMQNTETSKAERIGKDHKYWSASYGDVCRAIDAEIALQTKNEELERDAAHWIPVSERLPEPDDECLVWAKGINGRHFIYPSAWAMQREAPDMTYPSATVETGYCWDEFDFEDVSYWMLSPKPPSAMSLQEGGKG
jgi:Protein of unknown function (DUF551)